MSRSGAGMFLAEGDGRKVYEWRHRQVGRQGMSIDRMSARTIHPSRSALTIGFRLLSPRS